MGDFPRISRGVLEALLWPFDRLPSVLGLTVFSVVSGILMLLVVGQATPQKRLKVARDRMSAAVYEVRLFMDSPLRIFAAQGRLVLWSLLYLVYLLPAFLILLPPLALLYAPLEARYGLAPLSTDEPVLVKIHFPPPAAPSEEVTLDGIASLDVTAPPVFVEDEGILYVRLSASTRGSHMVELSGRGWAVEKRLTLDKTAIVVSAERRAGLGHLWALGNEPPLPLRGLVDAVTVVHPPRTENWLGLPIPWWAYWLIVATVVALLFRKRFGVTL